MSVYARRGGLWRCVQLAVSSLYWLFTLGGRLGSAPVVTLCYHGVADGGSEPFARQMRHIRRRAIAPHERGITRPFLSRPGVSVTFDDAFANVRRNALPTLQELGIPAVIFAVSENAGRPPAWNIAPEHPEAAEPTMTPEELREVANGEIEIASHTATHARLTDLDDEALEREVRLSKERLEDELGRTVRSLAFPHGAAGSREIEACRAAGYECVFTLDPGDRGEFVRGRYLMEPDVWPLELALTADGAYAWLVHVRRLRNALRRRAA